ncbi:AbiU2 domain-containing protein [Priestia megaterium]
MNTKAEYLQFRTSLFEELDAARACFDLYLHLTKQLDESTDIYLEALPFFQLTLHSLSRTAMAILTNVFEMRLEENFDISKYSDNLKRVPKKSKAKTIHKFLSGLDSNHKIIFKKDEPKPNYECIKRLVKDHQKLIEEHSNTIQTLMHRRDKYFAHLDSKYFNSPSLLDETAPIFSSQFLDLIEVGYQILNESPGGPLTMYAPVKKGYKEALDRLFFKVKEYNEKLASTIPMEKITTTKYEWDFDLLNNIKAKQDEEINKKKPL